MVVSHGVGTIIFVIDAHNRKCCSPPGRYMWVRPMSTHKFWLFRIYHNMIFRFDRFFFDEKDVFTALFGVFLVIAFYLHIPVLPFRFESLVVLFLFLVITRSLKNSVSYEGYVLISISGLVLSLLLSPYGLAMYLLISTLIYKKWGRIWRVAWNVKLFIVLIFDFVFRVLQKFLLS